MTPHLAAFLDQHGLVPTSLSALQADGRFSPPECGIGATGIALQNFYLTDAKVADTA
jgi:hypothetical protein